MLDDKIQVQDVSSESKGSSCESLFQPSRPLVSWRHFSDMVRQATPAAAGCRRPWAQSGSYPACEEAAPPTSSSQLTGVVVPVDQSERKVA